jgi:hypothetical protein
MMVFSPMVNELAQQRHAPLIPTPWPIFMVAPGVITINEVLTLPITGLEDTRVLIFTPSPNSSRPPLTQRTKGRPFMTTEAGTVARRILA